MYKRLFFSISLLLIFSGGISAQSYLVVNGIRSFALSAVQKITFSDGQMVVTTSDSNDSFALSALNGFKFSDSAIATGNENIGTAGLKIWATEATLYVSGATGSMAYLFNAAGALLYSQILVPETAISIGSLPGGVYFLKVNGQSYKFLKR